MQVEHLDDLPLLETFLSRMDLSQLHDKHFPDHGHWQGISGGQLATGWLLYLLSEGDHRLSHVEDWATAHIATLSTLLESSSICSLDFSDDRLGRLLDRYTDNDDWYAFEQDLGKSILEVYPLSKQGTGLPTDCQVVRTDSFNAPQYRSKGELFAHGYSKQRRSDQPFCKVMFSCLDISSIPLAVDIVKGSGPDVNHYIPIIDRVDSILSDSSHLYVGDSQLGSEPNREAIHAKGNYYLCPLGRKQCSEEQLQTYLSNLTCSVEELSSVFTESNSIRKSAYFFEITELMKTESLSWQERRILVYSPDYASGLMKSFTNRLDEAQTAIENLVISKRGRRNPKTLQDLHGRVEGIIKKFKVEDCFDITCSQKVETYTIQGHKNRPTRTQERVILSLQLKRQQHIIMAKLKKLGWQIYASNAPIDQIETVELVKCYRNEFRIEHLFDNIINKHVQLLPIYLQKETRVKGLIRLLSVAMRVIMLLQYEVRCELAAGQEKISGIYPGNKTRSTDQPTATMLLRAFKGCSLVIIETKSEQIVQITTLSKTQKTILNLLGLNQLYHRVCSLIQTNLSLRET